jgi:RNA polymerase sigma-70 factor (ECF subfamily)
MMDRSELELAWAELSIVEREILYLWAVEGYSTDEVAGHLDKPRNTVLSIIHRMRQRLQHRFGKARTTG